MIGYRIEIERCVWQTTVIEVEAYNEDHARRLALAYEEEQGLCDGDWTTNGRNDSDDSIVSIEVIDE